MFSFTHVTVKADFISLVNNPSGFLFPIKEAHLLLYVLLYGGVAVAVIFAITHFCTQLLKAIKDLLKELIKLAK